MNTALRLAANGLWLASALPAAWRFTRARRAVGATQARVLMDIVRANADTEFGRRHTFAAIDTPAAFQQRVPLATYADFVPAIDRIAAGVPNVLTAAPVKLLEPTSGSSAAAKLIPYTAPLQGEFQAAIAAWVVGTLGRRPALWRGAAYWSVSPLVDRTRRSAGGIPIGFEEDSA
ncbi:MAG: GH3 auxin-responsive promoter family protein, partial [Caldilineaceae bacterium]|nr:GH3 auxin-responsive promoter family protein [Caldilineaceae bacterium]